MVCPKKRRQQLKLRQNAPGLLYQNGWSRRIAVSSGLSWTAFNVQGLQGAGRAGTAPGTDWPWKAHPFHARRACETEDILDFFSDARVRHSRDDGAHADPTVKPGQETAKGATQGVDLTKIQPTGSLSNFCPAHSTMEPSASPAIATELYKIICSNVNLKFPCLRFALWHSS